MNENPHSAVSHQSNHVASNREPKTVSQRMSENGHHSQDSRICEDAVRSEAVPAQDHRGGQPARAGGGGEAGDQHGGAGLGGRPGQGRHEHHRAEGGRGLPTVPLPAQAVVSATRGEPSGMEALWSKLDWFFRLPFGACTVHGFGDL